MFLHLNSFSIMKTNEVLNQIFALAPKGNGAQGKEQSIYKKELFGDLMPKECKALRSKLRRNRDNFISSAIECKGNKKELETLKQNWLKYSESVYKDSKNICEANSNEQTQNLCAKFLDLMNAKA